MLLIVAVGRLLGTSIGNLVVINNYCPKRKHTCFDICTSEKTLGQKKAILAVFDCMFSVFGVRQG